MWAFTSFHALAALSLWTLFLAQTGPGPAPDLPPPATSTSPASAASAPASTSPAAPAGEAATQASRPAAPGTEPVPPAVGENVEAIKTYARGDFQMAATMLEQAHRAGKAGIQDRLILARAYLHLGRGDDALAVLKNVLDSDKENPDANSLTGQILLKAEKHQEAMKYLEHAYRLKPDPVTASALGRCYHALGDIPKAKSYLTTALREDIRDPSNSFLLGRIHLDRGSGVLAEKYLLMAQEAGLESLELHLLLGRAYLLQAKPLGPVMVKRLAGTGSPSPIDRALGPLPRPGDIVDAGVVLAKLPTASDQYQVSTRYCALYEGYQVLKAEPQHPDGLLMVASGWFAAGNNELAAGYLKPLLEKAPIQPRVWELQARLLVAAGDVEGLQKTVAAAQAGDPDRDTSRSGSPAKAFDARTAADMLYRAAVVLRSRGQRDQAIVLLAKAEQQQPTSEPVLRCLAGLHATAGNHQQAIQYYSRIVELFPDAADVDELRNALKVLQEKAGVQQ